jgi:hypothetical protein
MMRRALVALSRLILMSPSIVIRCRVPSGVTMMTRSCYNSQELNDGTATQARCSGQP